MELTLCRQKTLFFCFYVSGTQTSSEKYGKIRRSLFWKEGDVGAASDLLLLSIREPSFLYHTAQTFVRHFVNRASLRLLGFLLLWLLF